MGLSC